MPEMASSAVISYVNYVIDVIFFLDIVLNFRTTYFSAKTGDEIFAPEKIARNYLGGKLAIDLLASIPIDSIVEFILGDSSEL